MNWNNFFTTRNKWWDAVGIAAFVLSVILLVLMFTGAFNLSDAEIDPPQPKLAEAPTMTVRVAEIPPQLRVIPEEPRAPDPAKQLGFIVVIDWSRSPVIYEAVKGPITNKDGVMTYTNSEGIAREFVGNYFYSPQPLKITFQPLIATQTSAQFLPN